MNPNPGNPWDSFDTSTPDRRVPTSQQQDDMTNPFYNLTHVSSFSNGTTSVPKVSLSKFNGYSYEDGKTFLTEFTSYCTFNSIFDDARRIAAFHLHLEGPAKIWYNSLDANIKRSWINLYQHFVNQYANLNVFDPAMIVEAEVFESLTLMPHQQIEDFHSKILEKGTKLQKSQRDMISRFVNGLPKHLAFFVRTKNLTSLNDALTSAKLGEAYGYRDENPVVASSRATKTTPRQDNPQADSRIDELTERVTQLETGRTDRRSRYTNNRTSSRPVTCYKCSGENHVEKRCNWNGTGKKSPKSQCQLCFQFGHGAMNCRRYQSDIPNQNQGNVPSGPRKSRP